MDELARLRALIDAQHAIASCLHDPELVMDVVAHQSLAITGAEAAAVELPGAYRAVAGALEPGIHALVAPIVLDPGGSPAGTVAVSGPRPFDDRDAAVLATMAEFVVASMRRLRGPEERRATHDALTGLANQALLLDRTAMALAHASRGGPAVTILFIDVATSADEPLRAAATAMYGVIRTGDTLARVTGGEFVLLSHGLETNLVALVVRRITAAVTRAWPGLQPRVSWVRSSSGDTADGLLTRMSS